METGNSCLINNELEKKTQHNHTTKPKPNHLPHRPLLDKLLLPKLGYCSAMDQGEEKDLLHFTNEPKGVLKCFHRPRTTS